MRLPCLVLLALLAAAPSSAQLAKPVLGRAPFNGLKARVTAVRFFESGGGIPAAKDRVVTTRFDALTTRYINLELELEYAKAAKQTEFQVACSFEGPSGPARAMTLTGTVQPGWIGSYHAGGVGSPERGEWAEGSYRVSCQEEGQQIVAAQIEVVKAAPAVRALGAAVLQMKFYQSLGERLPVETRRYATQFDARTATRINTEFALVYPQTAAPAGFSVECAYSFPDGSVQRVRVDRQIPAGWTGSVHTQGVGWDEPGHWPVGKYVVSCWSNGEKMKEAGFEVFDSGAPNRESGGGRLRFVATRAELAAANPGSSAFELGSFDTLFVEATLPLRAAADSTAFGCLLSDPAGITSGFPLKGELREKDKLLVASGPIGVLDPPRLRGAYRVECRTGAKAILSDRFSIKGKPELPALESRLVGSALFAGEEEAPGDEAVPDVVFSAAKLKALWVVALLDHPGDTAGTLDYSCRVTGPRNAVIGNSGVQSLPVAAKDRVIVLRQRVAPAPKQRWAPGKFTLSCAAGALTFLRTAFDLTR